MKFINSIKNLAFIVLTLLQSINLLHAQDSIGSLMYEYHRNLVLGNYFSYRSLNVHSLSFSIWDTIGEAEHPWKLGLSDFAYNEKITQQGVSLLPLNQHLSFNSKYPRGFNDGPAWQGKGLNAQWSGGVRFQTGGLSLYLAPIVWYSQNLSFPLVPSVHESPFAAYIPNIDLPQRFGDSWLLQFDIGESEIRYDLGQFTFGVSNQSLWLGPSNFNAIILSNNAGGFPRIDLGLRRTTTKIGDIEFLAFLGFLEGSSYENEAIKNLDRYITGYTVSYAPTFIPGFTFGFHRTAFFYSEGLRANEWINSFLLMGHFMGQDRVDQRASITVDWLFPEIGFNAYAEWARNDFSSTLRLSLRELQHSQAYTLGIRHMIVNTPTDIVLYQLEITETMHTIGYQTEVTLGRGTAGFYTHHIVQHGHTHRGQLLGAAIGPGADSQSLRLIWYSTFGKIEGYLLRRSLNKDYIYGQPDAIRFHGIRRMSTEATIGINTALVLHPNFIVTAGFATSWMIAWNYTILNDVFNFQIHLGSRVRL